MHDQFSSWHISCNLVSNADGPLEQLFCRKVHPPSLDSREVGLSYGRWSRRPALGFTPPLHLFITLRVAPTITLRATIPPASPSRSQGKAEAAQPVPEPGRGEERAGQGRPQRQARAGGRRVRRARGTWGRRGQQAEEEGGRPQQPRGDDAPPRGCAAGDGGPGDPVAQAGAHYGRSLTLVHAALRLP